MFVWMRRLNAAVAVAVAPLVVAFLLLNGENAEARTFGCANITPASETAPRSSPSTTPPAALRGRTIPPGRPPRRS